MTAEITELDRGDRRTIRVTFTNQLGNVADPTAIRLEVRRPSPEAPLVYTYALDELDRVSTGVYERQITFDISGRWSLRGVGTGNVTAATEPAEVQVRDDPFDDGA